MNLQEERLRNHLDGYPFTIREVRHEENGWYVLTDRGRKRIIYCQDENLIRWSHSWREYLVNQGFRHVERYLVNGQGEHWVSDSTGTYALSDYWEQDYGWSKRNELQMEGYRTFGELLAYIHLCFDSVEEVYRGRYRKKGTLNETRLKSSYRHLHTITKEIESRQRDTKDNWLLYNFSRVVERVRKAEALYEVSGVENDRTPLSFAHVPLSSLVYWEPCWYITGLHNPVLVPRHEDTVALLEQIHEMSGTEGVIQFLSAYASVRRIPVSEKSYLLALLCYPLPILSGLESLSYPPEERERITAGFQLQGQREKVLQCVTEIRALYEEDSG